MIAFTDSLALQKHFQKIAQQPLIRQQGRQRFPPLKRFLSVNLSFPFDGLKFLTFTWLEIWFHHQTITRPREMVCSPPTTDSIVLDIYQSLNLADILLSVYLKTAIFEPERGGRVGPWSAAIDSRVQCLAQDSVQDSGLATNQSASRAQREEPIQRHPKSSCCTGW